MKLTAIFNAWADTADLLVKSIDNLLPVVDEVVVVWGNRSNKGEIVEFPFRRHQNSKVVFLQVEPLARMTPLQNETMKRNAGLDYARDRLATHFLMLDGDEFYHPEDIQSGLEHVVNNDLNGLVCGLRVYIKTPRLWCEDHTRIPFIHKMTKEVMFGDFKKYPFTYEKGDAYIDPSRRLSFISRIGWSEVTMHHFSYVRKDIDLKIRNSTANLERSRAFIHEDLQMARPGYKSILYHRELKECDDLFKIEEGQHLTAGPPVNC